jgi:hypothetical protein
MAELVGLGTAVDYDPMTTRSDTSHWRFAGLVLALCPMVNRAMAQETPPTFHSGVELSVLHVQVMVKRGLPLPELAAADFTVRIGSRSALVLQAEHLHLSDAQLHVPPYDGFNWPKDKDAAVYEVGVEANRDDCRQAPKVSLAATVGL